MIRITSTFFFILLFCCCCKTLFAQSNKKIDSLLSVLKTAKEDTGKVNTFNGLSLEIQRTANYSVSKKYADDALLLAEKINFKKGIAVSHVNIGNIYRAQGNYSDALKSFLASIKISEELGDKQTTASAYNGIGLVFRFQGAFSDAFKNHIAALKIGEQIGDLQEIASSYDHIGFIYIYQGKDFDKAMKNLLTASKIFKQIGDKYGILRAYLGIALVYYVHKNYVEALAYDLAALKIGQEIGDRAGEAWAYDNSSDIYIDQRNYAQALKYNFIALKIDQEIGANERICGDCLTMGICFERLADSASTTLATKKKYNEAAFKYLNRGLLLAKQMVLPYRLVEAYNDFGVLYSEMKDYRKALEYTNLRSEVNDSLISNETSKKLAQLETEYEVEKAESLAQLQNEKNMANERVAREKAKTAANRRTNTVIMTSGLLVLSLIFTGLLLRQRNVRRIAVEKATSAHKMAELELQSLRTQLNPHFMFNSLNSIQELILLEENVKSQSYLARFGKLLRMLLENAEYPFISLRKEIDFLQLYLGLENLRIPDLQYSISTDPTLNTEETLIPNMILQPYIENAIWHGLSHKENDKQLQIRIYRENGTVNYEIEDNGVGRKKAAELKSLFRKKHKSKGMELLSKRFKLLNDEYGSDIDTTINDVIRNNEVAGTLVRIKVPVKLSEHLLN